MPDQLTNGPHTAAGPVRGAGGEGAPPATLATVVDELRSQGASMRRTQQGFALFAVLALMLALVELIVIAAKLNGSTTTTVTRTVTTAAAAGTAAGTASGSTAAAALPHKVDVRLAEFTVTPSAAQAAAGKVTFAVANDGKLKHEFVVLRTNKPAGDLLKGAEADEAGNVGEIGDVQPGQTKNLTLKLAAGHYALICNLPGHYKAGQYADFSVKG